MLGQSAAVRRVAVLLAIWIAVLSISTLLGRFGYRDNQGRSIKFSAVA
jgi:hypothetical protein